MKIGCYKVNDVGGSALGANFVDKRESSVQSVNLSNGRIDVDGTFIGGEAKVSADYKSVTLEFESNECVKHFSHGVDFTEPRELYIVLRFRVDKYTMQIKEVPVKMTLDEIEKELGHKVEIVNK